MSYKQIQTSSVVVEVPETQEVSDFIDAIQHSGSLAALLVALAVLLKAATELTQAIQLFEKNQVPKTPTQKEASPPKTIEIKAVNRNLLHDVFANMSRFSSALSHIFGGLQEAPMPSADVINRLHVLDQVINELLDRKANNDSRKIMLFVQRTLRQFHLESYYSESEVITDAYFRTRESIISGKEITNLPAWLCSVSYNIVREYSRDKQKAQRLKKKNTDAQTRTDVNDEDAPVFITQETLAALSKTLEQLSFQDRQILMLRVVEGLPWKQVKERLSTEHRIECSELSLRKRGERALQRLRQAFYCHQGSPPL